jgi:hypothetical protein
VHRHIGPALGQIQRDLAANALGPACHQCAHQPLPQTQGAVPITVRPQLPHFALIWALGTSGRLGAKNLVARLPIMDKTSNKPRKITTILSILHPEMRAHRTLFHG